MACVVVTLSLVGTGATQSQLPSAAAQTSNIKRVPLQKFDVPGTQYETVTVIAEVAPNSAVGRHTHPGPETGYVLEGEIVLIIDGQPDRTLKAGESYYIPAGDLRRRKKSKPLASPAK